MTRNRCRHAAPALTLAVLIALAGCSRNGVPAENAPTDPGVNTPTPSPSGG